ncbi:MAG: hypothetical protein HGA45_43245 [Chloroflexales bacterium]|nr:hypothetical protein [Chloroflexales bacterium]
MGSTFSHLQVHSGGLAPDEALRHVAEALAGVMSAQGYTEAAADDAGELSFVLVAAAPWVGVYGSLAAQPPAGPGDPRALLSREAGAPVVALSVHDSDLLELHLFRGGRLAASASNWPGYFAGDPPPEAPALAPGALRGLAGLLAPGASPDELQAAWGQWRPAEGAERLLARLAPLLGWEPALITAGPDTLPPAAVAAGVRLAFSRAGQPGADEPPVFGHAAGSGPRFKAQVGQAIAAEAQVHNTGGPSQGLSLVVWGSALARGLVALEGGAVTVGGLTPSAQEPLALSSVESAQGLLAVATLPDLALPRGYTSVAAAVADAPGRPEQAVAAWAAAQITVRLQAQALAAGRGELHIGFVPAANPDAGQAVWSLTLEVGPAPV